MLCDGLAAADGVPARSHSMDISEVLAARLAAAPEDRRLPVVPGRGRAIERVDAAAGVVHASRAGRAIGMGQLVDATDAGRPAASASDPGQDRPAIDRPDPVADMARPSMAASRPGLGVGWRSRRKLDVPGVVTPATSGHAIDVRCVTGSEPIAT